MRRIALLLLLLISVFAYANKLDFAGFKVELTTKKGKIIKGYVPIYKAEVKAEDKKNVFYAIKKEMDILPIYKPFRNKIKLFKNYYQTGNDTFYLISEEKTELDYKNVKKLVVKDIAWHFLGNKRLPVVLQKNAKLLKKGKYHHYNYRIKDIVSVTVLAPKNVLSFTELYFLKNYVIFGGDPKKTNKKTENSFLKGAYNRLSKKDFVYVVEKYISFLKQDLEKIRTKKFKLEKIIKLVEASITKKIELLEATLVFINTGNDEAIQNFEELTEFQKNVRAVSYAANLFNFNSSKQKMDRIQLAKIILKAMPELCSDWYYGHDSLIFELIKQAEKNNITVYVNTWEED